MSVIVLALNFRQSIISYLLSFSEVTKPTKGFLVALLTGDKSYLEKTDYQLFRESGIIHVLAISGLHIGILYLTLYTNIKRSSYLILPGLVLSYLVLYYLVLSRPWAAIYYY